MNIISFIFHLLKNKNLALNFWKGKRENLTLINKFEPEFILFQERYQSKIKFNIKKFQNYNSKFQWINLKKILPLFSLKNRLVKPSHLENLNHQNNKVLEIYQNLKFSISQKSPLKISIDKFLNYPLK